MWFVLFLSCAEAPAKHNNLHATILEEPKRSSTKKPRAKKKEMMPSEPMMEMKSDMGEAKNDLSCIKEYLQCREEGSTVSFEDYELKHCK